jgi:hypothetical protein
MFKLKGIYNWKLINTKTGNIDKEGFQENIVSDRFLDFLCLGTSSYQYGGYNNGMAIQISDSTTIPGVDYRVAGASNNFNILATGTAYTGRVNWLNRSKYTDNNFSPGASPRTIRIIGIKIYNYTYDYFSTPNFVSFVELSTPITQNTDQYLYIKYTIYASYIPGLCYNGPNNRFIEFNINNSMFTNTLLRFGSKWSSTYSSFSLSYFLDPSDINKVSRNITSFYSSGYNEIQSDTGSVFARWFKKDFGVSEIIGPIGSLIFQIINTDNLDSAKQYFKAIYGYSPIKNNIPTVSRIYVHPAGREDQVFSDPSYPASSQGSIIISGTPTNKYPLIVKIRITKTGDASDLIDETIEYTNVNPSLDTITVSQEYTTGDIYKISSTGVLPSPLISGTNYYIIKIDSTTIKLASSYNNAIAGIPIDITTQGSGYHTLSRQNTGRYRLELRPFIYDLIYRLYQLSMAQDYDGYVMPVDLDDTTDTPNNYAEGDYIASSNPGDFYFGFNSTMLRGALKYEEYIYSIQQSRKDLINNICRWRFNTIETSQPLCKFGNSSTKVQAVFASLDNTKMYIATNEGLYEYSFLTPTTSPTLLTISGIIDNNIKDACIDPITGYIWTGHSTGLSKIDTTTWTAVQYTTSGALSGLSASEVNIYGGQLQAYNGRILRGGRYIYSGENTTAWVLDDGIGWYRVNGTNTCITCCLRYGTTHVVWKGTSSTGPNLYNVIVTGNGIGSSTLIESKSISNNFCISQMCYINPNTFIWLSLDGSNYIRVFKYVIGTTPIQSTSTYGQLVGTTASNTFFEGYNQGALRRNQIDLSDGDNVLAAIWFDRLIYLGFNDDTTIYQYGWDGIKWVKGNTNDRPIPKTNSHSLVSDLTINFNNATGSSWDQQFVQGDFFSFMFAPCLIKDNLQQVQVKARNYYCVARVRENLNFVIPTSGNFTIEIPEKTDPNFRDLDILDFITEVKEGSTQYTRWTKTGGLTFSVNPSTDIITVSSTISTGTPIEVSTSGTLPSPLEREKVYYAINVSSNTIRLATSYNNAISNIYIDLTSTGSGTQTLYKIIPNSNEYYSLTNGIFIFSSSDAGKTVSLTYTYTVFTT